MTLGVWFWFAGRFTFGLGISLFVCCWRKAVRGEKGQILVQYDFFLRSEGTIEVIFEGSDTPSSPPPTDDDMTTDKPLSVGVLGAARIAKKNCRAASHPYTSCRIAAVASRGEQKGKDFINEIFDENADDAPFVHGGNDAYNTLLENTVYDAVYIPLPTKLHETYVGKALTSGKHVLLEKPVAPSAEIYRQMLTTASENGKFLLDGTMFVHHPRTKSFITSIPNPNRVHFNFTFAGDDNFFKNDIRTKKEGDFLGCVGDLGWYCVRMGLLVFTGSDASVLKGSVTDVQVTQFQLNDEGVPLDADCLVYFSGVSFVELLDTSSLSSSAL